MPSRPEPLLSAQDMARRNNENQAVQKAFLIRRRRQRTLDPKPSTKTTKRSKIARLRLDGQEAEREARPIRAVGFFLAQLRDISPAGWARECFQNPEEVH